jgi:antitoxin component HigA of HigAB toxin-antitoxin module
MIVIEYDDYLEIVKNLKKIKNKEEVDLALNKIENLFDKIRINNSTMNDGRD